MHTNFFLNLSCLLVLCLSSASDDVYAQPPLTDKVDQPVAKLKIIETPGFSSPLSPEMMAPQLRDAKWLTGIEKWTEDVFQRYVVMVPGSEGYPPQHETRQRFVSVAQERAHRWLISKVEFLDINLAPMNADEAERRILQSGGAFLLAASKGEITEADRNLYNPKLVIVKPK